MRYTQYFLATRQRPDRIGIREDWIAQAVENPEYELLQADGRIRRWIRVDEMEGRWLRVVLLDDGVTVHYAFFDRRFKP